MVLCLPSLLTLLSRLLTDTTFIYTEEEKYSLKRIQEESAIFNILADVKNWHPNNPNQAALDLQDLKANKAL